MDSVAETSSVLMAQQEKRPLWASLPTLERLKLLKAEVDEAIDAVTNDETPEHIISELGDIGYQFLSICADLDLDPIQAIQMKMVRNEEKYLPSIVNGCTCINEASARAGTIWEASGGDEAFFERYLTDHQGEDSQSDSPSGSDHG